MSNLPYAKKSLGQHWLTDQTTLTAMCDAVAVRPDDTVLEIGPGLGTLTQVLVQRAAQVVAVEFDEALAHDLPTRVKAANLQVVQQDILRFDLTALPPDYAVVANIPYYLTSNLIRLLSESPNMPRAAALLVQKEVAERVCAAPGDMSLLSVTAQFYWQTNTGLLVPAKLFTPPPKVDSQILILQRRPAPLFADVDARSFFRLVKAGFSNRRKTLANSLSAGLHCTKLALAPVLAEAHINPSARPQELSMDDWYRLFMCVDTLIINK